MAKRILRIVKCINNAPSLAICEYCNAQFPTPSYLIGQREKAEAAIQAAFDAHKCKPGDCSQNAVRIVREATEDK
jgi:hypothetical protein